MIRFLVLSWLLVVFKEALLDLFFWLLSLDVESYAVSCGELSEFQGDPLLNRPEGIEHIKNLGLVFAGLETGDEVVGK